MTIEEPSRSRLSRGDWVKAGLNMLVAEGIDAVQITRLATELDVSRGSFYWHFDNRDSLLEAMIVLWRAANSDVMDQALGEAETLTGGMLTLFSIWVEDERFSPLLDQAMRAWGRLSPAVGEVVSDEDDERVAAIARFFKRMGYESGEAMVRARVIYYTQIGYYALNVEDSMTARLDMLATYFRIFTGREIDEDEAAPFRARQAERARS